MSDDSSERDIFDVIRGRHRRAAAKVRSALDGGDEQAAMRALELAERDRDAYATRAEHARFMAAGWRRLARRAQAERHLFECREGDYEEQLCALRDHLASVTAARASSRADVAKLRRERENDAPVKRATRRAEVAEAERDALRERVRVLEAVAAAARASVGACEGTRDLVRAVAALDAAEPGTREPDDGKVRGSLAEAVEVVKGLPEPTPEAKRISGWNRLYREQKRGGDR